MYISTLWEIAEWAFYHTQHNNHKTINKERDQSMIEAPPCPVYAWASGYYGRVLTEHFLIASIPHFIVSLVIHLRFSFPLKSVCTAEIIFEQIDWSINKYWRRHMYVHYASQNNIQINIFPHRVIIILSQLHGCVTILFICIYVYMA